MGSYTFNWPHPAQEVFVTGTFDDWKKTVQLEKEDGIFTKRVRLPSADNKVLYKFVVDGRWVNDYTAPTETDAAGNTNNVLTPASITAEAQTRKVAQNMPAGAGAFVSGVSPDSSSAQMAGRVPLEHSRNPAGTSEQHAESDMPGSFPPETPFQDAAEYPHQAQKFFANPLPASAGIGNPVDLAPGEKLSHPSSSTANTVPSSARDDYSLAQDPKEYESKTLSPLTEDNDFSLTQDPKEYERTFGITPLPATAGLGNPVNLQPGQQIPSIIASALPSQVKHDPGSYEKSDAYPGNATRDMVVGSESDMPPLTSKVIPESSLPINSPMSTLEASEDHAFRSAAGSTTSSAALPGSAGSEIHGVPSVVRESQQQTRDPLEASAVPDVVQDKRHMQEELRSKVPEEQPLSQYSSGAPSDRPIVPEVVSESQRKANVSPEISNSTEAVREKLEVQQELKSRVPVEEPKARDMLPSETRAVPEVVSASQHKAHAAPEASASPEVVEEKSAVEHELLSKVSTIPPAVDNTELAATSPHQTAVDSVPEVVRDSQQRVNAPPEAAAASGTVAEKSNVEDELKSTIPKTQPTSEGTAPRTGILAAAAAGGAALLGGAAAVASSIPHIPASIQHAMPAAIQHVPESIQHAFPASIQNAIPASIQNALPASIQHAIADMNASKPQYSSPVNAVPERVLESQRAAHESPEASANPEAVSEKAAVEHELMKEVKPTDARGIIGTTGDHSNTSNEVPDIVTRSQMKANQEPEAAANPEAVLEKAAVENQLKGEIKPISTSDGSKSVAGENHPPVVAEHKHPATTGMTTSGLTTSGIAASGTVVSGSAPIKLAETAGGPSTLAGARLMADLKQTPGVAQPSSNMNSFSPAPVNMAANPARLDQNQLAEFSPIRAEVEHQRTAVATASPARTSKDPDAPTIADDNTASAIEYNNRDGGSGVEGNESFRPSPATRGFSETTLASAAGLAGVGAVGAVAATDKLRFERFTQEDITTKLYPPAGESFLPQEAFQSNPLSQKSKIPSDPQESLTSSTLYPSVKSAGPQEETSPASTMNPHTATPSTMNPLTSASEAANRLVSGGGSSDTSKADPVSTKAYRTNAATSPQSAPVAGTLKDNNTILANQPQLSSMRDEPVSTNTVGETMSGATAGTVGDAISNTAVGNSAAAPRAQGSGAAAVSRVPVNASDSEVTGFRGADIRAAELKTADIRTVQKEGAGTKAAPNLNASASNPAQFRAFGTDKGSSLPVPYGNPASNARDDTRDVSPMSRSDPATTTGVSGGSVPEQSGTPATQSTPSKASVTGGTSGSSAQGSPSSNQSNSKTERRKSKRMSGIFGKIREKLHRDK